MIHAGDTSALTAVAGQVVAVHIVHMVFDPGNGAVAFKLRCKGEDITHIGNHLFGLERYGLAGAHIANDHGHAVHMSEGAVRSHQVYAGHVLACTGHRGIVVVYAGNACALAAVAGQVLAEHVVDVVFDPSDIAVAFKLGNKGEQITHVSGGALGNQAHSLAAAAGLNAYPIGVSNLIFGFAVSTHLHTAVIVAGFGGGEGITAGNSAVPVGDLFAGVAVINAVDGFCNLAAIALVGHGEHNVLAQLDRIGGRRETGQLDSLSCIDREPFSVCSLIFGFAIGQQLHTGVILACSGGIVGVSAGNTLVPIGDLFIGVSIVNAVDGFLDVGCLAFVFRGEHNGFAYLNGISRGCKTGKCNRASAVGAYIINAVIAVVGLYAQKVGTCFQLKVNGVFALRGRGRALLVVTALVDQFGGGIFLDQLVRDVIHALTQAEMHCALGGNNQLVVVHLILHGENAGSAAGGQVQRLSLRSFVVGLVAGVGIFGKGGLDIVSTGIGVVLGNLNVIGACLKVVGMAARTRRSSGSLVVQAGIAHILGGQIFVVELHVHILHISTRFHGQITGLGQNHFPVINAILNADETLFEFAVQAKPVGAVSSAVVSALLVLGCGERYLDIISAVTFAVAGDFHIIGTSFKVVGMEFGTRIIGASVVINITGSHIFSRQIFVIELHTQIRDIGTRINFQITRFVQNNLPIVKSVLNANQTLLVLSAEDQFIGTSNIVVRKAFLVVSGRKSALDIIGAISLTITRNLHKISTSFKVIPVRFGTRRISSTIVINIRRSHITGGQIIVVELHTHVRNVGTGVDIQITRFIQNYFPVVGAILNTDQTFFILAIQSQCVSTVNVAVQTAFHIFGSGKRRFEIKSAIAAITTHFYIVSTSFKPVGMASGSRRRSAAIVVDA